MIYVCDRARHLVCYPYSLYLLQLMAKDLGIKECWFHKGKAGKSHYDIPIKRIAEISAKCVIVSSKQIIDIMAKKPQVQITSVGILNNLNNVCRVYGLDFELLIKSNKNVTYIKATSRLHRPSPNTVIGHLMSLGWKALQTNTALHKAYRFKQGGRILVITFPTRQTYEKRSNMTFTDDHGERRTFNGIVNQKMS